eukprot:Lankesteria_metandrocarpae@DN5394_c1_g1_i1.p1
MTTSSSDVGSFNSVQHEDIERAVAKRTETLRESELLGKSFVDEGTVDISNEVIGVRFENIEFEVDVPDNTSTKRFCIPKLKKKILKNISDDIPGGCMVALMGASGAGKTSLLNVLARRNKHSTGTVYFNDHVPSDNEVFERVAFIQQDDIFFGNLTVKEHLSIQADLRLPRDMSDADRERRVNTIIRKMSLKKCEGGKIGNPAIGLSRGISGGEKKRLNIASELLTAPSIIFADEPTTGLDSHVAGTAVSVLRELADRGHTVICTIHQPNSHIFQMFDWLLLMGEGLILYSGDRLGSIKWFNDLGYKCPLSQNPAEFIVRTVAVTDDKREEKLREIDELADEWKQRGKTFLEEWESKDKDIFMAELAAHYAEQLAPVLLRATSQESVHSAITTSFERQSSISSRPNVYQRLATAKSFMAAMDQHYEKIGLWKQFRTLLRREFISGTRDPILVAARGMQSLVIGLVVGFLFFRLSWSYPDSLTKISAIFTILMNQSMTGTFGVVQVFPEEKPVVKREYKSGFVKTLPYITAKMVGELPVHTIFPILFITLTYFLCGLNDNAARFFISMGVLILVANVALSIGYFASAAAPDVDTAISLAQSLLLPLILFSGFLVDLDDIPGFWIWIEYMSPFKYGMAAFSMTVFWDETVIYNNTTSIPGDVFVSERLGFTADSTFYMVSFLALAALIILLRIFAIIALELSFRFSKSD